MSTQVKKIILAPMEGVIDAFMRNLLTSINSYDLCITEFVRVVDSIVPKHMFKKICPELMNNAVTMSGTPIRVQLLGQEPNWLAENAVRALELGSHGIDINFGCPAKAVNKSKGGAVLLDDPELIYKILSTIKNSINSTDILSAKIRLGFNDVSKFSEVVDAVKLAGTNMLTVHARSKKDGYKPPAYWRYIGDIAQSYTMDIIANGEIWTKADAKECMAQSNTNMLMLGRGALAMPNLANIVTTDEAPMPFSELKRLLYRFSAHPNNSNAFYFSSRLKQWLKYLKLQYPEAEILFDTIKKTSDKNEILAAIEQA